MALEQSKGIDGGPIGVKAMIGITQRSPSTPPQLVLAVVEKDAMLQKDKDLSCFGLWAESNVQLLALQSATHIVSHSSLAWPRRKPLRLGTSDGRVSRQSY